MRLAPHSLSLCAMNTMNENHVSIKLFEFAGSPGELSPRLKLEPTRTALKGEESGVGPEHLRVKRPYPWNLWEYRWTRNEERFIGDLIEEFMVQIVEPRMDDLRDVIATCSAELSVVQYYYTGCNPGVHFSRKTLNTLAYIGAETDVDIYCLADDDADHA